VLEAADQFELADPLILNFQFICCAIRTRT